nr:ribonuclease H-like domain, reverse transcriptase, RNA-dependent DNA polymerase [Tanacetum cinerariifolium]
MVNLAFCDYHNMVSILEKTEHNTDFHQIVDFLDTSHIRYALTISLTVYVSHIRKFWSTVRIETTDQETKIIATVDGKSQTISKSSLRRHLKLNDEEGISYLPDAELFENLSLMGYNILPNQSNIATAVVCLATNRVYNFSKMIFDGMVKNINSKGTKFLMYPRRLTRRAIQIAQSKALSPAADEPALLEPVSYVPTDSNSFVSADGDAPEQKVTPPPQITTVTSLSAKFPYLKKGEYDIWVVKMQNYISSTDLQC